MATTDTEQIQISLAYSVVKSPKFSSYFIFKSFHSFKINVLHISFSICYQQSCYCNSTYLSVALVSVQPTCIAHVGSQYMFCCIRLMQNDSHRLYIYCVSSLIHEALCKFIESFVKVLTMMDPRSY